MGLSYEEVQNNIYQLEFYEVNRGALEDFWDFLNEKEFIKEHKVFYPKGIFTEKGIESYYFFTELGIIEVTFSVEPVISFWKYEHIYNYRVKFLDRYDLELEINLKDKTKLIFNTREDTNEFRNKTMKDKVLDILAILEKL